MILCRLLFLEVWLYEVQYYLPTTNIPSLKKQTGGPANSHFKRGVSLFVLLCDFMLVGSEHDLKVTQCYKLN